MSDADETNRPGCYENLAYHLDQSLWFLDRLKMKALHDNVRDIQEQVLGKWELEKRELKRREKSDG